MKQQKEDYKGILKRLGIFLAVCALAVGALFLYVWLRGDTEPVEAENTVRFGHYALWALALLIIWGTTKWIMNGKK